MFNIGNHYVTFIYSIKDSSSLDEHLSLFEVNARYNIRKDTLKLKVLSRNSNNKSKGVLFKYKGNEIDDLLDCLSSELNPQNDADKIMFDEKLSTIDALVVRITPANKEDINNHKEIWLSVRMARWLYNNLKQLLKRDYKTSSLDKAINNIDNNIKIKTIIK